MSVVSRCVAAFLAAGMSAATGVADERSDAVARQKTAAQAKLDAAKLKLAFVETEDMLFFAPVPADRTRAIATAAQKSYGTAAAVLQYDSKDMPFTGKLTVFVIAGLRPYKSFVLDALKQLPESSESTVMDLRSDAPYLVIGLDSERPSDSQIAVESSRQVAAALLSRKAGVGRSAIAFRLPQWLRTGFGQAIHVRSDGSGNRLSDHKQRVRAHYTRTRGLAFQGEAVWGSLNNPQRDLSAASLAEYLAYGPQAARFPALLAGFKPQDDNVEAPAFDAVLAGMEWKLEDLEAGWRKWVVTGK